MMTVDDVRRWFCEETTNTFRVCPGEVVDDDAVKELLGDKSLDVSLTASLAHAVSGFGGPRDG